MFRNVITDLDSSKTSGPKVVLKNCKLELSYILAYLLDYYKRILFFRLLENLIYGPRVYEQEFFS